MLVNNLKDAGILSAVVAVAVYINTLDCGMIYDDEPAIKWNRDVRSDVPWSQLLLHDFWGTLLSNPISHKSYRPLCVASFRLNYMLHGLDPMGYHLVNVLLHAVVCYLYVQLCALVFTAVWPALLAGLLFAVHPIHTEAVAGIVGRAELLSAIFFLSSFLVYSKSLSLPSGRVNCNWLLVTVSIVLSMLAMLSKEQGITSLALCLIYDFFIFNQLDSSSAAKSPTASQSHLQPVELPSSLASKAPVSLASKGSTTPLVRKGFFIRGVVVSAAALVAMVIRLAVANGTPIFTASVNPPLSQESPYRQLSWLHLIFVNLWLLLAPSKLSVDWRYGAVPLIDSAWDWSTLSTAASLASLAVLSFIGLSHQRKNSKAVLISVSLMVFPFLPASNLFFPVGFVVAERVLYLPSMGFCMLVVLGLWKLWPRISKLPAGGVFLKVLVGYLLVVSSIKTLVRNRTWYSASSLHQAGVVFNPNNPILLSNLGIERAIKEDYTQAELLYLSSMKQTPTFSGAYYNYGMLMKLLHRYQEAEEPLLRAIELGSDTSEGKLAERYELLATVISMNTSRLNEALKLSNYVLSQHPAYSRIYNTRCLLLIKLNRTHEFIPACETAVRRNPALPDAHYNLGMGYMKLGYLSQAEVSFRNMVLLSRGSKVALFHLATVLQTTGHTQELLEARTLWQQVLAQEPTNIQVLMNLAHVDSTLHRYSQALDSLETVLAIRPDHKEALYKAGQLLYRRDNYAEAVSVLSRLSNLHANGTGYLDTNSLLSKARTKALTHRKT